MCKIIPMHRSIIFTLYNMSRAQALDIFIKYCPIEQFYLKNDAMFYPIIYLFLTFSLTFCCLGNTTKEYTNSSILVKLCEMETSLTYSGFIFLPLIIWTVKWLLYVKENNMLSSWVIMSKQRLLKFITAWKMTRVCDKLPKIWI